MRIGRGRRGRLAQRQPRQIAREPRAEERDARADEHHRPDEGDEPLRPREQQHESRRERGEIEGALDLRDAVLHGAALHGSMLAQRKPCAVRTLTGLPSR
ncbi:MAG TPA: hypothetical protein VKA83_12170 [Methylomirabilota bacterium]|nr:hypothetical protein [Methylomirabilota bacterium]